MHIMNGIMLSILIGLLQWATCQWDVIEVNGSYVNYRRITDQIVMVAPINRLNQEAIMDCAQNFFTNDYFIPIEVTFWTEKYLEQVREIINNKTENKYQEAISLRVESFRLRWRDKAFVSQAASDIILTEEWIPNKNSGVLPKSFTYLLGMSTPNKTLTKKECISAAERLRHGRSAGLVNLFLSEFVLSSELIDTELKSDDIRMIFEKDLNIGNYIKIVNSQKLPFLLEKTFIRDWASEVLKKHLDDYQLPLLKEKAVRQQIEDYICHNETTVSDWKLYTSRLFRQIYPRLSRTDMSTKYSEKDFCTIKSRFKSVNLLVTSYTISVKENTKYVDYLQI